MAREFDIKLLDDYFNRSRGESGTSTASFRKALRGCSSGKNFGADQSWRSEWCTAGRAAIPVAGDLVAAARALFQRRSVVPEPICQQASRAEKKDKQPPRAGPWAEVTAL